MTMIFYKGGTFLSRGEHVVPLLDIVSRKEYRILLYDYSLGGRRSEMVRLSLTGQHFLRRVNLLDSTHQIFLVEEKTQKEDLSSLPQQGKAGGPFAASALQKKKYYSRNHGGAVA